MLSKEEISKLKINVFNQCDDETIRLVAEMLKHTDKLEEENKELQKSVEQIYDDYQDIGKMYFNLDEKRQKLIEKLEEDIKKANQIIEDRDYRYIQEVIDEAYERLKYAQEILSIVKGEKKNEKI